MKKTEINLSDILIILSKKEIQIKLLVGYQDSINGYGWHSVYYIQLIKCIEYCYKCRKNYNTDYKDDYYPLHHQHSHRQEYKTIFAKEFRNETDMINELLNYI